MSMAVGCRTAHYRVKSDQRAFVNPYRPPVAMEAGLELCFGRLVLTDHCRTSIKAFRTLNSTQTNRMGGSSSTCVR